MNRLDVIMGLIQKKKFKNYLEIGVFNGHIFFKVKSNFKIAVDPNFTFDSVRKFGKSLLNPSNFNSHFFEKTSDDFFENDAEKILANKKIELTFIDGMHEYEYALRDVENTLRYLDDAGAIVLHDCNPVKKESSISYKEWTETNSVEVWNGDVWKAILHLRCLRPDLSVFVLDTDEGLGIVTKKPSKSGLTFTKEQIESFDYEDLDKNRKEWLDLKPKEFFNEFLNT